MDMIFSNRKPSKKSKNNLYSIRKVIVEFMTYTSETERDLENVY